MKVWHNSDVLTYLEFDPGLHYITSVFLCCLSIIASVTLWRNLQKESFFFNCLLKHVSILGQQQSACGLEKKTAY